MTVSEPVWTPDDLAVALASRRASQEPRNAHGILLSEATDPELQEQWEVPLPKRLYPDAKLRKAQADRRKRFPDEDERALIWNVRRKEPPIT